MRIVKNGNVYRKLSWFEENEKKIYECGIIVLSISCFILFTLMI